MKRFIYFIILLIIPAIAFSQKANITWDGSTDSDWQTASNWSGNAIPTSSDNVTIANVTNQPIIDDGATVAVCNNLTINSGADLTIASNGRLTVSGTLANNAGNSGIVINAGGSLIHSTASIAGTVEITLSGDEWHHISAPVSGLSNSDFSSTDFLTWDATAQWDGSNYDPWSSYSGSLADATGYANRESATTKSLTGNLHQGNMSVTVYKNSGTAETDQGWNLIGNPYTSAIDWTLVDITTPDLKNAIYFYDDANGRYASWVDNVGTNGGTKYIPVGQGFFVKAKTDNKTLTFANDDRVHNSQSYWKENKSNKGTDIVRLIAQGNGLSDEIVVRFKEGATYNFDDDLDASKIISTNEDVPQIYTTDSLKTIKYSINSLPFLDEEIAIPMGIKVTPAGSYSISASEINIDYRYLMLEDMITGETINLRTNPVYTFSYAGGVLANEGRFILHIIPNSSPVCANPIDGFEVDEDETFELAIPENVFTDADDDELTYFATQQDGSNLPSWLNFTSATRTFSGLPENSDVGILPISLYALDNYGDTAVCNFNITISNINDTPFTVNIADQVTYTGTEWTFTLPENTFYDIDENDVLTYSANLVGGNDLPIWLNFNAETQTFSGTPETSEIIPIQVTATDLSLESITNEFNLHIIQTVGVENINGGKLSISPNPSNGIFSINGKNITNVEIVDISGKIIYNDLCNNLSTKNIYIENVPKGLYFIKIKTDTELIIKKIIVN